MSQSLARALSILVELGEAPRTLDELAAEVGVHKTTVLRLLRTMEEERFVHRDGEHRFHLGSRLFAPSGAALEQRGIRDIAAPHLAAQGFALDDAEHETFIRRVAAPVRDARGLAVAAASISVPDVLLGRDQVIDLLPDLLDATHAISADCGFPPR